MKFFYGEASLRPSGSGCYNGGSEVNQEFIKETIDEMLGPQEHVLMFYHDLTKHLNGFVTDSEVRPTDIDGLILPICHGDDCIIANVLYRIGGCVEKMFKEDWRCVKEKKLIADLQKQGRHEGVDYARAQDYVELFEHITFRSCFRFPIFEAYRHVPGYRDPSSVAYMGRPPEPGLNHVKEALIKWIQRNYADKILKPK